MDPSIFVEPVTVALGGLPASFESTIGYLKDPHPADIVELRGYISRELERFVVRFLNVELADRLAECSCEFVHESQKPGDVQLRQGGETLLRVELKSAYALAVETGSRSHISPNLCGEHDLISIIPWSLSHGLTGIPVVPHAPFVTRWRSAAEAVRGHFAQMKPDVHLRLADGGRFNDAPAEDATNYGRLERTGIMDAWLLELELAQINGIAIGKWKEILRFQNVVPKARKAKVSADQMSLGLAAA